MPLTPRGELNDVGDPDRAAVVSFLDGVDLPLRQALVARLGIHLGAAAHAAAMEYGWLNADRVRVMDHPVGYLYRVGLSKVRPRRKQIPVYVLADRDVPGDPGFEPGLQPALARLPIPERVAVFLCCGCGWSYAEVGRLLDVAGPEVSALERRALDRLRTEMGAP
jgi:DNA-directed RNA polymerase specialized sigma24 family protein